MFTHNNQTNFLGYLKTSQLHHLSLALQLVFSNILFVTTLVKGAIVQTRNIDLEAKVSRKLRVAEAP